MPLCSLYSAVPARGSEEHCQKNPHSTSKTHAHTHTCTCSLFYSLQIFVPWHLFCQTLLLCLCVWRSHSWPGVMMMLIITPHSIIIPLNGYGLPLLLSHFLSFFFSFLFLSPFAICYRVSAWRHAGEDRRQNGRNDWPWGWWRWRRDEDKVLKPLDSLNLINTEATRGSTEVTR